VVINYSNVPGIALTPFKADAPAVIDANTILSISIANQCLQVVRWWDAQVLQTPGDFKLAKFTERRPLTGREPLYPAMIEKRLSIFATERLNHADDAIFKGKYCQPNCKHETCKQHREPFFDALASLPIGIYTKKWPVDQSRWSV
jgi:hypothetical protein